MGGAPDYRWWGNARVTPWMAYQLDRLNADLRQHFGVSLVANSGIRLPQEQIDVFLQRYVTAGNVKGRKVYDTRWWRGQLWYRISAAGTVAVPGTSNHEVQGSKAAVDIADNGRDAGITNRNSIRGRWIRANAPNYGLIASGDGFGEGWHFDIIGIWNTPPASGGGSNTTTPKPPEEDNMAAIVRRKDHPSGHTYIISQGYLKHLASQEEVTAAQYQIKTPVIQADELDFQRMIWNNGLAEFPMSEIDERSVNGTLFIPSWNDSSKR